MRFLKTFITIILAIPFVCIFLYSIYYPRESTLLGKRWQFNNQNLEVSDAAIKHNKIGGIIGLIVSIVILVLLILSYWL